MQGKIGGQARRELVVAVGQRYRAGTREEKRRILDEFVAVTGWHRKHAIRTLNTEACTQPSRRPRARLYDDAIGQALVVLWEAADRVCGKRLRPLIPTLLVALERHGHLKLDEAIRTRVLEASPATIDRMLAGPRAVARGRSHHRVKANPSVRRTVPVRTFADWKDPLPGGMEADLVAHCGGAMDGSFVHTLVLTDVASGWTECVPLVVRESALVIEAIERLRNAMPFPLRSFDTDNGSEFINEALIAFCKTRGIEFTRSRPYRKNDQAWVEQKNGSVVRRLVGYGRLEGLAAADALARLYRASRLFVNFFQPSFKLVEKKREGARVLKRYDTPATPCARLLGSESITEATKEGLRKVQAAVDPLQLLDEIRAVQSQLAALAAGERAHVPTTRNPDLEAFLASLGSAWRAGEVRPTHQPTPKPVRDWRTRTDPFEGAWPTVRAWLDADPDRTAKELLQRLQEQQPGVFPDGQLRTLQRRVREWRAAAAKSLLFGTHDRITHRAGGQEKVVPARLAGTISLRQAGSAPS